VRAELELAAAPAEGRRAREAAIGARRVLITRAVDAEVFVLGEAFRMRQDHDPDRECSEAELIGLEDLTSTTSGPSAMTQTELRGNHKEVVIRLFDGELLEEADRTLVLPEVLATELTCAVVVEAVLAGLRERLQHLLDGLVVGRRDGLPLRDGEPSFGVLREFRFGELLLGVADTWEELAQNVGLLRDPFDLVALGIGIARPHFFVGEAVRHRELPDGGDDASLKLVTPLDELLDAVLVQADFLQRLLRRVFDETEILLLLSIRDGHDRLCRHRQPPVVLVTYLNRS